MKTWNVWAPATLSYEVEAETLEEARELAVKKFHELGGDLFPVNLLDGAPPTVEEAPEDA